MSLAMLLESIRVDWNIFPTKARKSKVLGHLLELCGMSFKKPLVSAGVVIPFTVSVVLSSP